MLVLCIERWYHPSSSSIRSTTTPPASQKRKTFVLTTIITTIRTTITTTRMTAKFANALLTFLNLETLLSTKVSQAEVANLWNKPGLRSYIICCTYIHTYLLYNSNCWASFIIFPAHNLHLKSLHFRIWCFHCTHSLSSLWVYDKHYSIDMSYKLIESTLPELVFNIFEKVIKISLRFAGVKPSYA